MPPDECRSEGTPSLSEGPDAWGEPFGSFLAFEKGTRRKGETASRPYRSNGYVLNQQEPGRLSGRLRWQASSHRRTRVQPKNQIRLEAVFAGKPRCYRGSIHCPAFTFSHKADTKSLQNTEPTACHPTQRAYIKASHCVAPSEELFIYSGNS
jgi:hypothetical protein